VALPFLQQHTGKNKMTQWVDLVKEALPEYAKDTKLNLDAVIKRSTLDPVEAEACALAALVSTGNGKLLAWVLANTDLNIKTDTVDNVKERDAAMCAASIMAQNNVWYPFVEMAEDESLKGLPAQLRMNAIASHGGTTKARFEAYSLAASIVGKCHFCVKAHYDGLKTMGYTVEQLRDIGRIAAVMNSVAKVLNS
jgi:alkyl hydroperoxide reductase subunit D